MSDPIQFAVEAPLDEVARRLATQHSLTTQPSGQPLLLLRLKQYEIAIKQIYDEWSEASAQDPLLPSAADRSSDNYYIVRQVIQQLKEDLPPTYYHELPVVDGIETEKGNESKVPRVMACALVEQVALQTSMAAVIQFLRVYQTVSPLTMGELWAVPSMLRYVLLERLAGAAARLTHHADLLVGLPQALPAGTGNGIVEDSDGLPVKDGEAGGVGGERDMKSSLDDDRYRGHAFVGLRVVNNTDWKLFFEAVSLVHAILIQDPAGIYAEMNDDTRNRYRQQVSTSHAIAARVKSKSLREVALAQQTSDPIPVAISPADPETDTAVRTAHVGYYLLAEGRRQLEDGLEYAPPFSWRLRRLAYDHPTTLYFGSIGLLTLIAMSALIIGTTRAGGAAWQVGIAIILGIVPALTFAVSILHWLLTLLSHRVFCQRWRWMMVFRLRRVRWSSFRRCSTGWKM